MFCLAAVLRSDRKEVYHSRIRSLTQQPAAGNALAFAVQEVGTARARSGWTMFLGTPWTNWTYASSDQLMGEMGERWGRPGSRGSPVDAEIGQGSQNELTGGGLFPCVEGWLNVCFGDALD
jgi:hypothetical protein